MKYLIASIIMFSIACNNNTNSQAENKDTTEVKELIVQTLKTPFEYNCEGEMKLNLIESKDAGFTHQRNEGMRYAGEILFNSKCKEMHYYLFFGVGDIFYPFIDVYEEDQYKDRISIYENGHFCGDDIGFYQKENTSFNANGKIISISETTEYDLDSSMNDIIDSTKRITYDTLILDLKDWCMR